MRNQHAIQMDRTDAARRPDAVGVQPRPTPVFVDRTGRRRRLAVLAGLGLGAGLVVSLVLLGLGLLTGGSVPVPGWPGAGDGAGQGKAGVGRPGTAAPTSAGPSRAEPAPTSRPPNPRPRSTLPPSPTVTDRPGQGELHRNPSPGKSPRATNKPGKPDQSSTGVE